MKTWAKTYLKTGFNIFNSKEVSLENHVMFWYDSVIIALVLWITGQVFFVSLVILITIINSLPINIVL
jgi:hypothetical protein